jgi:hypothetical protein
VPPACRAPAAGVRLNQDGAIDTTALLGVLTNWLFNYNTVEAVMLFGAVIVNLMGVMYSAQKSAGSYYTEARDAVTTVVLIVIIGCILYFVTVVVVEITTLSNASNASKARSVARAGASSSAANKAKEAEDGEKKKLRNKDAAGADMEMTFDTGKLDMAVNPLMMTQGRDSAAALTSSSASALDSIMTFKNPPPKDLWKVFAASYVQLTAQVETIQTQVDSVAERVGVASPGGAKKKAGSKA